MIRQLASRGLSIKEIAQAQENKKAVERQLNGFLQNCVLTNAMLEQQ